MTWKMACRTWVAVALLPTVGVAAVATKREGVYQLNTLKMSVNVYLDE